MTCPFSDALGLFHHAARFLDPNDVGVIREIDHQLCRHVVSGALWDVVDDDRQRRAISDRAKKCELVQWRQLRPVIIWGAYQGHVVTEFGRVLDAPEGFDCRFRPAASN